MPVTPPTPGGNSGSVRYGYIDPAGRTVLKHVWITAQPFSEGLAFVESPFENRRHTRGYVDATGKLVLAVPDQICMALPFTDGLAMVAKCQDGPSRYGYMDRTGQMRIGFKYANAAPFRDGLAAVKFSDGLSAYDWGYIDTNGTVVIAPRFKDAGSFAKGVAYVEAVTNGNWIIPAVINRTGAVVVDKPFLFEWSSALFGVPSLEQFRKRQQMVFDDLLIPRCEGTVRGYVDIANRLVIQGKRFQTMRRVPGRPRAGEHRRPGRLHRHQRQPRRRTALRDGRPVLRGIGRRARRGRSDRLHQAGWHVGDRTAVARRKPPVRRTVAPG